MASLRYAWVYLLALASLTGLVFTSIILHDYNRLIGSTTPYKIDLTNTVNSTDINSNDNPYHYQAIINITTYQGNSQLFCVSYPQLKLVSPDKKLVTYAIVNSKEKPLYAYPVDDSNKDALVDSNCSKNIPRIYVVFGDIYNIVIGFAFSIVGLIFSIMLFTMICGN